MDSLKEALQGTTDSSAKGKCSHTGGTRLIIWEDKAEIREKGLIRQRMIGRLVPYPSQGQESVENFLLLLGGSPFSLAANTLEEYINEKLASMFNIRLKNVRNKQIF